MTAYTKTQVGNKQFVIEWILDPAISGGDVGAFFEMVDCKPLSIYGKTSSGLTSTLQVSNDSDPETNHISLDTTTHNHFLSPLPDSFGNVPLPPPVRWVRPSVSEGEGLSRVSMLFEII